MAIRFQTTEQDMVAAYRLHYTMSREKAAWVFGAFVLGLVGYLTTEKHLCGRTGQRRGGPRHCAFGDPLASR